MHVYVHPHTCTHTHISPFPQYGRHEGCKTDQEQIFTVWGRLRSLVYLLLEMINKHKSDATFSKWCLYKISHCNGLAVKNHQRDEWAQAVKDQSVCLCLYTLKTTWCVSKKSLRQNQSTLWNWHGEFPGGDGFLCVWASSSLTPVEVRVQCSTALSLNPWIQEKHSYCSGLSSSFTSSSLDVS
jgi:hypothetical protein